QDLVVVEDVDVRDLQVIQVVLEYADLVAIQGLVDGDGQSVEDRDVTGAHDADAAVVLAVERATAAGLLRNRGLIRRVAGTDAANCTEGTNCTNEHHGTKHG